MSNLENLKKDIIQKEDKKELSLQALIQQSSKELGRALPSHLKPDRIVRIALTCIRLNPDLANCTKESFLGSLFTLAQVGIEPVAGRAYLLPFNNYRNGKTLREVQAVIGYKGLIELFYRHESALSIDMHTVYVNDAFEYQYGTNSFLHHKPSMTNRGEAIGYYASAKMKGGASVFKFMSKEDALNHGKKHSKTYDSKKNEFSSYSPWKKEEDAMCKKTVLIQLSKLLPLSVELQKIIAIDETSRDFKSGISDTLDMSTTTNWNDEEVVDVSTQSNKKES